MSRVALTLLIPFLALAATASAQDDDPRWYLTPMITGIDANSSRFVDDGVVGLHLALGRKLNSFANVEFTASGMQLDGFDESDQWGVEIDLIGMLGRGGGQIQPYVLAGVGYLKTQRMFGEDTDNGLGSVGIGTLISLGETGRVSFRPEIRYRGDFASPNISDVLFNAGLQFSFGVPAGPPDADGDGVADPNDNCPNTPPGVTVDASGCELDNDGDGVANSRDRCPNTPAGVSVDSSGCEITLPDGDRDGVPDRDDACPDTPAGAKVDSRGCELDSDGDGVADSKDRCPGTAEGVRVDVAGCEIKERISLPGVTFELDSARLKPSSTAVLDEAAATLKKHPDIVAEVAGHTDALGPEDYNQRLSQRRAEAVRNYLIARGIDPSRLQAKGYGESAPIASNDTADGQARNRRVELGILSN